MPYALDCALLAWTTDGPRMLSDEIRARLAQLHAAPPAVSPTGPLQPLRVDHWRASTPLALNRDADVFDTAFEHENASGKHLRFRRRLHDFWPAVDRALAGVERAPVAQSHHELASLACSFPREVMFLDLETCGFAGSMVFLVGLVWHDDELIVDQLLARNYAEERALLETLWQIAGRNRVLVTFNGKSFDWPMVHDRSTRHHLGRDTRGRARQATTSAVQPNESLGRNDPRPQLTHCDLLHHARRRWKRQLPNCRLQTLEWHVCRRLRHDDLPGALVPAAYHDYVRTGETGRISPVLQHNALDLVTLAHLACRLLVDDAQMPQAKRA
jgi:uncharacterized protein YprB with RNaseH-like and TPR domain